MAQAALDKHYGMLSATERFALMIEAMARRDERECDRLEETCPRFMYRCEDQAFRDRMRRASAIAHRVSLNMREGLAQIRLARLFHEHAEMFAGDSLRIMQTVFLYGREYGKWEVGAIEEVGLPDAEGLVDDIAAHPDLGDQLKELREIAKEGVARIASGLRDAVGEVHAVDLLSQWEGFGCFCREALGVEPLTVMHAFGLERKNPAADILQIFPQAPTNSESAAEWEQRWIRSWQRRFEVQT